MSVNGVSALPTFQERFARQLVRWQRVHGRHGLPWQTSRDPYRVWLSEVMLQQTQVTTVLRYYGRFLERFPDVVKLAQASQDEVLSCWSGLGYYSRARNLHRCAQEVMSRFDGKFPVRACDLETLPGIGRSTAAAIAAFCFGERVTILDGNVRRVLSRLLACDGNLSDSGTLNAFWATAQTLVPDDFSHEEMIGYTQGLMDLGALVCRRARPDCDACPVALLCSAKGQGKVLDYPKKLVGPKRQHQSWWLGVFVYEGSEGVSVWLEKRPQTGIWAGLYCVPVFLSEDAVLAAADPEVSGCHMLSPVFVHSLTHRELRLHPVVFRVPARVKVWASERQGQWVPLADLGSLGMPAPVYRFLVTLVA